jgi:hypothetical protein
MFEQLAGATILWTQGGLGNQLFQLAAGRRLVKPFGSTLFLSRSSYYRDPLRSFQLDCLPVNTLGRIQDTLLGWPYRRSGEVKSKMGPGRIRVFLEENLPSADLEGGGLIVGFFQGRSDIDQSVGSVVTDLKALRDRLPDRLVTRVRGRPVIHVRRGDYVTSPAARNSFAQLGRDYYQGALDHLGVSASESLYFTDDAAFVMSNWNVPRASVFAGEDTANDLDALLLMSLAGSLAIANSTFSWWAARLTGPETAVCCPRQWFVGRRDPNPFGVDGWTLIDNS